MSRTMITPIIAVLVLATNSIFNVEIGKDVESQIVDIVGSVMLVTLSLIGIFKNHKK